MPDTLPLKLLKTASFDLIKNVSTNFINSDDNVDDHFDGCLYMNRHKYDISQDLPPKSRVFVANVISGNYRVIEFVVPDEFNNHFFEFTPIEKFLSEQVAGLVDIFSQDGNDPRRYLGILDFSTQKCELINSLNELSPNSDCRVFVARNNSAFILKQANRHESPTSDCTLYEASIGKDGFSLKKLHEFKAPSNMHNWILFDSLILATCTDFKFFVYNMETKQEWSLEYENTTECAIFGTLRTADKFQLRVLYHEDDEYCRPLNIKSLDLDLKQMKMSNRQTIVEMESGCLIFAFLQENSILFGNFVQDTCIEDYYRLAVGKPESLLMLSFLKTQKAIQTGQIQIPAKFPIKYDF